MWEFYLISVEMMFRTGSQMVFQMQLTHQRDAVPLTRDYIAATEQSYVHKERGVSDTVDDDVEWLIDEEVEEEVDRG